MRDPNHICDLRDLDYQYVDRNGFKFLYRIICRVCGRYSTCNLVLSRDPMEREKGKMVGFWNTLPREIPGRLERRALRNVTAVPWNYYDEGYDPEKRYEAIQRNLERVEEETETDEERRVWKSFGGFHHWP